MLCTLLLSPRALALRREEEDVDDVENRERIEDEERDEPPRVADARSAPQGVPLPGERPERREDHE